MYGAMFGDYVGSVYEFDNIKTKEFNLIHPKANITDDSYMTIAVASACLRYAEHRNMEQFTKDVESEMRRVGRRYPFPMGSYGTKFMEWLRSDDPKPYGSWGNGSAMRVSPCAWVAESLLEAELLGWASALPTHNHPDALLGAKATAGCIYLARTGKRKAQIHTYLRQSFYPMDRKLDEIRPGYTFDGSCKGTVPVALQAFLEGRDYEDAIRNAISVGGDSDTIAAITGAVAEAFYGFPEEHATRLTNLVAVMCKPQEVEIINTFRNRYCSIEEEFPIVRLTQLLKDAGISRDDAILISLRVRRPSHRKQMTEWLEQNKDAAPEEICIKSREFSGQ